EDRKHALDRPHPAEGRRRKAHRFGPVEGLDDRAQNAGQNLGGDLPCALEHREIELALVGRAFLASSEDSPADLRKPCTAASGAPTRGPRRSSLEPGCVAGKPSARRVSRRGVTKETRRDARRCASSNATSARRRSSSAAIPCI